VPDFIQRGKDSGYPADCKLIAVTNCSYVNALPNVNRIVQALKSKQVEFVFVQEQFMTPTVKLADIVLPTNTFIERNDIANGVGLAFYGYARKVIESLDESKSHLEIATLLASKLGISGFGDKTEEEWLKEMAEQSEIPDYEQFKLDKSITFTTRGCIRDCGFCIVQEKEGSISEEDLKWLLKGTKIVLFDNNFLASSKWKEKLEFFIEHRMKVCFTQGLDIRLVTKENAEVLAKVKWYNHTFRGRTLYFAFDEPKLASILKEKVKILIDAGIKPGYLLFYVLVGFNTTLEEDLFRIKLLYKLGVRPFVMIYNNRKDSIVLRDLARWVNLNYYKVVPFKKYKPNRKHFGRY